MPPPLIEELSARRLTFVVGKGGTGKSTTAAAIALAHADTGRATLLLSTDPAPSIADIFGIAMQRGVTTVSPCSALLTLEELDADGIAAAWLDRARDPLERLIEQGTYLSASEIEGFTHLTLPGVDELAGAIRIARPGTSDAHVVIDTAPTGHTLRMLDSARLIDSWVAAFRAMADKASAVAMQMAGGRVRLDGEDIVAELSDIAAGFRQALDSAAFVVVTRADAVVQAETARLLHELRARACRIEGIIVVGECSAEPAGVSAGDAGPARLQIPWLTDAHGCDGLRAWPGALRRLIEEPPEVPGSMRAKAAGAAASGSAATWLRGTRRTLLWFAGKGGVGKSTCAAAAAVSLAADRRVLLCSTDPAGSLADVFGGDMRSTVGRIDGNLRVVQVDAAADLAAWRDRHRSAAEEILGTLGFGGAATLDRAVIDAAWEVVPPGVDELFALAELLDAAESDETVIVDASPTGHFLRLLASPSIALDWTHALMRIILNYGVAGKLDDFSERMLAFARQLKHLSAVLTDPARCGVFVVSLPEPVVEAQTQRLIGALREARIAVAAQIMNRAPADRACAEVEADGSGALICAPHVRPAPRGARELERFVDQWTLIHE